MNPTIINGCRVSQTFQAGFVNFHLGEIENHPGHYKVWRQNPRESNPAWERQFTDLKEAMICLHQHGIDLAEDQKKRTEGMGIRKKMRELER